MTDNMPTDDEVRTAAAVLHRALHQDNQLVDMTDRILVIQARGPGRVQRLPLGTLSLQRDGWRFMPLTTSRKASRKGHSTWEAALPRWTGGLSRTESLRMEPGEKIADALRRFPAAFETA